MVPHDVKTLIHLMGGAKTFESRLDMMVKSTSYCSGITEQWTNMILML